MARNRFRLSAVLLGAGALLAATLAAGGAPVAASQGAAQDRAHGHAPIHVPKAPRHVAHYHGPHALPKTSGPRKVRPHPLTALPSVRAASTVFTVNSTVDSPLDDPAGTSCVDAEASHRCSLRAAVQAANNIGGPVLVKLAAREYDLNVTTNGVLAVHNTGGTSILGQGPAKTTVAVTTGSDSVFEIDQDTHGGSGTLTLSSLRVTGGSGHLVSGHTYGGGVLLYASNGGLVLNRVSIGGNHAENGAGISCYDGGSVWITGSSIVNNHATDSGGGIQEYWCGITITDSAISGNHADSLGGGMFNEYGSISISDSKINGNRVGITGSSDGEGGGIYDEYDVLSLSNTQVHANAALADTDNYGLGGGLFEYLTEVTASGGSIDHNSAKGTSYSSGGGMYVYYGARIALHGVHLDDNSTQYNGSTDYCAYGGGGIFLDAYDYATSIVIDHGSSVSRNTTGGIVAYGNYGGALLKISNTTLSRNTGIGDYSGGAICAVAYNGGTSVHLDHATVDKNIDHGYWSSGGIMALANQEGGVDLTIKNSSITGNVSSGQYGTGGVTAFSYSYSNVALDMVGTTLSGNRAPNQGYGGALQLYGASSYSPIEAVLTKDTFLNNTAGTATDSKVGYGGAITAYYYITIDATAVTVTGNRALGTSASSAYGGGVYLYTYETSAWTNSTISKNRATGGSSYGGGVYSDGYDDLFAGSTIDHNQAAYGGGIYESSSGYTLRLNRSTVSNNRAGTAGTAGYGGGLYLSDTAMLATNSTFAGNAATGAGSYGGAIYDGSGSSLTLDFVTISGNAASLGGGIYDTGAGGSLRGSILGGNTKTLGGTGASNCVFTAPYAALSSVGHNVLSNGCVQAITFGDDIANPHLGSLASNGGPTKTMKPLAGSPALGNGGVSHPTTDQRGVKRHNVTDSGAFELT